MPPASRTRRPPQRAASTAQLLELLRLLVEGRTPGDLAKELSCARKTVERLLHAIEAAGLPLHTERRGSSILYRLPKQVVRDRLGL